MRTFWRHAFRHFFAFPGNKHDAYARALRCLWHLPFGIKERKKRKRERKREREREEEEGGKKISHKESRVNGLKVDPGEPVARRNARLRATMEAERMEGTRRKDGGSKIGIAPGVSLGFMFGDALAGWFEICMDSGVANREGLNRHRYWVNRMKNKSGWYRCVYRTSGLGL